MSSSLRKDVGAPEFEEEDELEEAYFEDSLTGEGLTQKQQIKPTTSTAEAEEARRKVVEELERTEEEMRTLKSVLEAKEKRAEEIRKRLGITTFQVIKSDVQNTLKTFSESNVVRRTSIGFKDFGQWTAEAVTSAGATIKTRYQDYIRETEKPAADVTGDAGAAPGGADATGGGVTDATGGGVTDATGVDAKAAPSIDADANDNLVT